MNHYLSKRFHLAVQLAAAFLLAAILFRPVAVSADCCGSGADGNALQLAFNISLNPDLFKAFPTLFGQFGGKSFGGTIPMIHSGATNNNSVQVSRRGMNTITFQGNETRYGRFSPNNWGQNRLPGIPTTTTSTGSGGGSTSFPSEEPSTCPKSPVDSNPPIPRPDETESVNDDSDFTSPATEGGGGGDSGSDLPEPQAPRSSTEPSRKFQRKDLNGHAVELTPGTATFDVDSTAVPVVVSNSSIKDVSPGVNIALALGGNEGYSQIGGYLEPVPVPSRIPSGLPSPPFPTGVGPEKLEYYQFRNGTVTTVQYGSFTPPANGLLMGTGTIGWRAPNGLTVATQVSITHLEFKLYPTGNYTLNNPIDSPPFNITGAASRTTTIERLTSGNPDNGKYAIGYRTKLAEPGRATKVQTVWVSGLIPANSFPMIRSYRLHTLEDSSGTPLR